MATKVSVSSPSTSQSGSKRSPQCTKEANKRNKLDERQFEPLNTSLYQILMESKDTRIFDTPRPIIAPLEKRNQSKHYLFHNDKGYVINEFRTLKISIEYLMRKNMLLKCKLATR